ncbi:MAG: DUF4105 domain-containing protein [Hyphomonadaceae bacterium]
MKWVSAHPLRTAVMGALAIALVGCATSAPSNERNWYPYLARTADVSLADDRFTVAPVSDWTYAAQGPLTESYTEASFAVSDVRNVWFVLEPQPGSRLAAHTLLLFEFQDDRMLGLTIEARREANEDYSALRGAFNTFELAYVWAEARDLLTRRAVMLDHEVFVYPVSITDEQERVLLRRVLERTEELETRPRFYNTLFSNCTNELAKAAGFHWAPAFILTGTSDEYLFDRGIIPGESFEAAHAASDLTDFIAAHAGLSAAEFDAAILAELRRRAG